MKPRMMSKAAMDHLFFHILDGFKTTNQGIQDLYAMGTISTAELADLLKKNSDRLVARIQEFKALEKLMCIFFAAMFSYMQIGCEDIEMRRVRRGVRIRKMHETEHPISL